MADKPEIGLLEYDGLKGIDLAFVHFACAWITFRAAWVVG